MDSAPPPSSDGTQSPGGTLAAMSQPRSNTTHSAVTTSGHSLLLKGVGWLLRALLNQQHPPEQHKGPIAGTCRHRRAAPSKLEPCCGKACSPAGQGQTKRSACQVAGVQRLAKVLPEQQGKHSLVPGGMSKRQPAPSRTENATISPPSDTLQHNSCLQGMSRRDATPITTVSGGCHDSQQTPPHLKTSRHLPRPQPHTTTAGMAGRHTRQL